MLLFKWCFCRRIGTVARLELQKYLKNTVHLVLDVKVLKPGHTYSSSLEEVGGDPLFLQQLG